METDKADEIPALGSDITKKTGKGAWLWEALMDGFVQTNGRTNFLNSENHKLSVAYTTDEWKEGIKYIRSLCDEGLFDPVSFSQDADTFSTVMNAEGDPEGWCILLYNDFHCQERTRIQGQLDFA